MIVKDKIKLECWTWTPLILSLIIMVAFVLHSWIQIHLDPSFHKAATTIYPNGISGFPSSCISALLPLWATGAIFSFNIIRQLRDLTNSFDFFTFFIRKKKVYGHQIAI